MFDFTFDNPSRTLVGFFIRHGELTNMDVWDEWTDLNLSEEGRQQAEKAAQWLSYTRIGRIISSDTPRTVETAQFLLDTGIVDCPFLATDPNLRPWKVGSDYAGKEKTPERLASFKKYLDDPDLVPPDGENKNQVRDRVQVVYQYLATPYNGHPTAVFIHNSVIKILLGLDEYKEAVSPGGVIAVYLTEKGEFESEVVLGHVNLEKGIS